MLSESIEELRNTLGEEIEKGDLHDETVQQLSRKLDLLINEFHRADRPPRQAKLYKREN